MAAVEIITKEDLSSFRTDLLKDIEQLLNGKSGNEQTKYLKSYQVKNMLKISPGTLQTLRVNGTLSYTKIGGILYYKYEDIQKLLEGNRKNNSSKK
jgi:Helix-turn-helix domain